MIASTKTLARGRPSRIAPSSTKPPRRDLAHSIVLAAIVSESVQPSDQRVVRRASQAERLYSHD